MKSELGWLCLVATGCLLLGVLTGMNLTACAQAECRRSVWSLELLSVESTDASGDEDVEWKEWENAASYSFSSSTFRANEDRFVVQELDE